MCCVPEGDAQLRNVGRSFCGGLRGDELLLVTSSSPTNGFDGIFCCRLELAVSVYITIATIAFVSLMLKRCSSVFSNCFGTTSTTRFSRTSTFSAYRFFVSYGSYSKHCLLFNYDCIIDLPSSGALPNFSLVNQGKLDFTKMLNSLNRSYVFCTNVSSNR